MPYNLWDYEEEARSALPRAVLDYYAGGSADEVTLRRNRAVFDNIALQPRVLRDVSRVALETSLLSTPVSCPLIVAPTAYAALAHPEAECAIVQGAGSLNALAVLSINASRPLEEIAAAAPARALLWQQLYLYEREVTRALLKRIEAAGYHALVVTADRPRLGKRERDLRNHFHVSPDQAANFAGSGVAPREDTCQATWEDIAWLRTQTTLPIVLKGILSPEDARMALDLDVSALIVSNHGGRQLDGCVSSIEALPEIVEAVAGRCEVYVDGGIRRGTDVLKALALGARAVLIGRPILWGLAVDGAAGVQRVLTTLREELELAMALCGCPTLDRIAPEILYFPSIERLLSF